MGACNGSGFGYNNSVYVNYFQDAALPAGTYDMHTFLGSKTSCFTLTKVVSCPAQFPPWTVRSQKLTFLWDSLKVPRKDLVTRVDLELQSKAQIAQHTFVYMISLSLSHIGNCNLKRS